MQHIVDRFLILMLVWNTFLYQQMSDSFQFLHGEKVALTCVHTRGDTSVQTTSSFIFLMLVKLRLMLYVQACTG